MEKIKFMKHLDGDHGVVGECDYAGERVFFKVTETAFEEYFVGKELERYPHFCDVRVALSHEAFEGVKSVLIMERYAADVNLGDLLHAGQLDVVRAMLYMTAMGIMCAAVSGFKHNDLHTENVVTKKTEATSHVYFYQKEVFQCPTYGRTSAVVDYGRAVIDDYQFNNSGVGGVGGDMNFLVETVVDDLRKQKPKKWKKLSRTLKLLYRHPSKIGAEPRRLIDILQEQMPKDRLYEGDVVTFFNCDRDPHDRMTMVCATVSETARKLRERWPELLLQ